ncbi:MAG TPA: 3-hydroxyacyl-CoA dehydrogenase family protein [Anaerohalosphaeraceae bacterium]|mgnify:CR=1 FL=1|nr:3-hydroxyacyl-CoA dehydrogenase family protein [Anaerohalosphaeraceae bacterium]HOT72938.1 3-hydroxyacyl-CoA dehydrogenase family protein [Anaerohalosphaeraceae bacterium]HPB94207.1 3-hydroxyacyl-CoA dehydrogenase family protein [Anaerohalosphaeraceae bacterium]HQJ67933.1 3-hydroxyacyl-CoA dehydrogenase family protein [Anaerohalosphaeraceae bacterium]HRT24817.1 3-hydroxyacyl-CoA dehydrogenase family protein [Anaerohalosphaeraceae bacterium]
MERSIQTVLVLGASGTIGSLAGGLLAQNGFRVYFLSRHTAGSLKGLERAIAQARSEVIARNIICGDYDGLLAEGCEKADWILECVAEEAAVKQAMYERIEPYRRPGTLVSSVTSSLVLEDLPKGRSSDFQKHFLSTHFYNPPGKMLACEICGQSRTDPSVVDFMADFLESRLRRVVIRVRPTAGFAGNRIAFLLFAWITELAEVYGVEKMDYLIGPYTGRIMAPLATIDLVGLDIHQAIIQSLQKHTSDFLHHKLVLPDYVRRMIEAGHLGRKAREKGGFYRRLESGKYEYIDPKTLDYIPSFQPHVRFVEEAKQLIHLGRYWEAFDTILRAEGTEADIVKQILSAYLAYSYGLVGEVTEPSVGIAGIDKVMSAGFNWAAPSVLVYMLGGREKAAKLLSGQGFEVPAALQKDTACEQYPFNAGKYFPAK